MPAKLNIWIQYIIPQHTLSWLAGKLLTRCRWRWLKNYLIRTYIKRYQIDLKVALLEQLDDYPDFNSFFTRLLKPAERPITPGPLTIVSPVDGTISQIGTIAQDRLLQAKGFYFDLTKLLGDDKDYALHFVNGGFATFYLAPKDYHRVHMPIKGSLHETIHIPGRLFSVNAATTQAVPQLFTRNERLVCIFKTEFGFMAVILVGAIFVNGIQTIWPYPSHATEITRRLYPADMIFEKGVEIGHFDMGSTVIVLFPAQTMQWLTQWQVGASIKMGEALGEFIGTSG